MYESAVAERYVRAVGFGSLDRESSGVRDRMRSNSERDAAGKRGRHTSELAAGAAALADIQGLDVRRFFKGNRPGALEPVP